MVSFKLNFQLYERNKFEVIEFIEQKTTENGIQICAITLQLILMF